MTVLAAAAAPVAAVQTTLPAPSDAAPDSEVGLPVVAEPVWSPPPVHDVEAPEALRRMAQLQGGLGYLPADRLAPRVIPAQNAWLMTDILQDVVSRGTAARARSLGRTDLAGKTGTSQGGRDTWFNGFNSQLVASVWVGQDDDSLSGG